MNIFEVIREGCHVGWNVKDLVEMYDGWAANKNSSFSNHCGFFCMEVVVQTML